MEDMTLMGWSWDQWAIAAARLGRPDQITFENALRMRRRWQQQSLADPGEVRLTGVQVQMDHEFSCELFSLRLPYAHLAVRPSPAE
jgi:hypothetical protein